MRLPKTVILGGGAILLLALAAPRPVAANPAPDLSIETINITGDEFVRLKNIGSAPVEMSNYWLGYSSDPEAIATPQQQLPVGKLMPASLLKNGSVVAGQSLLLSREPMATCGAAYSGKLDFSLSNSNGALSLWQLDDSSQPAVFRPVWQLTWGGTGIESLPISLGNLDMDKVAGVEAYLSNLQPPEDLPIVWLYDNLNQAQPGPNWYVGYQNKCTFTPVQKVENKYSLGTNYVWQQSNGGPPLEYAPPVYRDSGSNGAVIPSADRGLKAAQLSEILPNPASPKLDSKDEFVELYNPNDKAFNLSGFVVQTASASSAANHKYHIPAGTMLPPHGFLAFSSGSTSISLSNSGGQAWLVDPLGKVISQSQPWGQADDGQAWINVDGNWRWTSRPTPGNINKVAAVLGGQAESQQPSISDKKVAKIVESSKAKSSAQPVSQPAVTKVNSKLSVHPLTLAIVALAALLYGCYEYRYDIANRYRIWRAQRTARR